VAQHSRQFRDDIARSRHRVAIISAIVAKVCAGLEVAASSRALQTEQRSVLVVALQTLRRDPSC
jgi:hypothetical protein